MMTLKNSELVQTGGGRRTEGSGYYEARWDFDPASLCIKYSASCLGATIGNGIDVLVFVEEGI